MNLSYMIHIQNYAKVLQKPKKDDSIVRCTKNVNLFLSPSTLQVRYDKVYNFFSNIRKNMSWTKNIAEWSFIYFFLLLMDTSNFSRSLENALLFDCANKFWKIPSSISINLEEKYSNQTLFTFFAKENLCEMAMSETIHTILRHDKIRMSFKTCSIVWKNNKLVTVQLMSYFSFTYNHLVLERRTRTWYGCNQIIIVYVLCYL